MKTVTLKACAILAWLISSTVLAEEGKFVQPSARAELAKIPWLKDTQRRQNRIWQTKYDASTPERAYRSRIVAYAGKWTRHGYGGHGGFTGAGNCGWRYASGPFTPKKDWLQVGQLITGKYDIDGDGDTKDDFVYSLPFSMDVPLSIPDWPGASVFPERLSSTFYGGITFYCGNNKPDTVKNFSGEMGVNADHSGAWRDGRAEDHPINGFVNQKIPGSFIKHYVNMIWKKEDFLNNGDQFNVSFDDNSRLATFVMRTYWYGWNDVRYIVQNKDNFYISEIIEKVPDYAFIEAKGRKPGYLPICHPTKTKWAEYNPKGYKTDFDPTKANFETVVFDDVRAVGWYLAKTNDEPAQTHCKWYGFACDAVVTTPQEPSPNIEMVEIKGKGTPDLNFSICEVPYALWQDIYRFGDSPSHILEARYVYDKSGSMGSMAYGKRDHEHDEPLTDITFYDALALCNTLSEMEGKAPCYYLDPGFKRIFRNQHIATLNDWVAQPEPKIYVKWAANGHRLPTTAEWKAACGRTSEAGRGKPEDGTHPVGTRAANANGMYDMMGNVWELCWTFGDVYDPAADPSVTALGGDFLGGGTVSPYGDTPYFGCGNLGIRLVCRESGGAKPAMGEVAGVPAWQFKKGQVFGKKAAPKVTEPVIGVVRIPGGTFLRHDKKTVKVAAFEMSKYATTYDCWKTVKQWGEANGYDFDHNGDMGSMFFFDFTHSPDEPVTHISWYDIIVWCNTLSEMEGKTPCYYYDEACTKVGRKSFAYKAVKVDGPDYIRAGGKDAMHPDLAKAGSPARLIFTRWDEDGYRLPTAAEMEYAIRGGKATTYHWGNDDGEAGEYMWSATNSQGRTHKVGQKRPNPFGLYDIQGNVFEILFSNLEPRDKTRPIALDLDNPIHSPYAGGNIEGGCVGYCGGPSYLYGGYNLNGPHGLAMGRSNTGFSRYYADMGFRPVRCEAGTHPRDGLRPLEEIKIVQYMDLGAKEFDDLGTNGAIYRSDVGRGGVFEKTGIVEEPKVTWKFKAGGEVNSSPVVWDEKLFIGADDGIHCLNTQTGKELWQVPVKGGVDSSACVANGLVFFATKQGQLLCLDATDGKERWSYRGRIKDAVRSSPAVAYGMVFCALGGETVAVDMKTGRKIWSWSGKTAQEYASLALSPDAIFAPDAMVWGGMNCYDYETTHAIWTSKAGRVFFKSPALIKGDGLYLNVCQSVMKMSLKGTAEGEGRVLWSTFLLDKSIDFNTHLSNSAPSVWNDKVFACRTYNNGGKMVALNTKDGKLMWQRILPARCLSDPSVAAKSGTVIFGCHDGNVYALDCETGHEKWKFKTGGVVLSSPWIGDGVVYIASHDGFVYALEGKATAEIN